MDWINLNDTVIYNSKPGKLLLQFFECFFHHKIIFVANLIQAFATPDLPGSYHFYLPGKFIFIMLRNACKIKCIF